MPAMGVIALIVLGRVLTLPPDAMNPEQNVTNGLAYMWNPRWDKLWDAGTWMAAAGQIFFSLSVGFGVIINYASYLRKKDDVVLSGLTAAATNEYFEVAIGGLITLTAAFVFLGDRVIGGLPGGTFGLGFTDAAGRVRAHAARQRHRRAVVLHAVPGGDHELALDAAADPGVHPGGPRRLAQGRRDARHGDQPGRATST